MVEFVWYNVCSLPKALNIALAIHSRFAQGGILIQSADPMKADRR
jgi:hypothetical protein